MATSQRRDEHQQQEAQVEPGPSEISQTDIPDQAQDEGWVNEGYKRWLEQRSQWTSGNRPAQPRPRSLALVTHEMVLGERPFPRAVPLEAVIECLVELWEEDDDWN